ncbi:formin-like protein 6 [Seriola dumerili]|nr:formin-like protein 6 [Seriola dumerili]
MAVKKSESSTLLEKVDGDKDADESKPEPAPRSKPPSITPKPPPSQATKLPQGAHTSCPTSPTSPTSPRANSTYIQDDSEVPVGSSSAKGPLPAPRLKRAPSEQERESTSSNPAGPLSPLDVDFSGDGGDAFDPPGAGSEPGAGGGRQWSSLKSSASPPPAGEQDRERTKSLPTYVTPPSLADTDLSPAEEEVQSPTDNKSEEESSEDTPSV